MYEPRCSYCRRDAVTYKRLSGSPTLTRVLAVLCLITTTGCGLTTDRISIAYTSHGAVDATPGAAYVAVKISVADQRAVKDNVGKKGDEYGFLGAIVADTDIPRVLANAITLELERRGFPSSEGGVLVYVELVRFYNEFKGDRAEAEVIFNAQVRDAQGVIAHSKLVEGRSSKGALGRSGSNAKQALEQALSDAVEILVKDEAFIAAIIKAAQTRAAQSPD